MKNFTDAQIAESVRKCVAQCDDWTTPLTCVANHVAHLVKEHGWLPDLAHEVGLQSLRVIDPSHPLGQQGRLLKAVMKQS